MATDVFPKFFTSTGSQFSLTSTPWTLLISLAVSNKVRQKIENGYALYFDAINLAKNDNYVQAKKKIFRTLTDRYILAHQTSHSE